MYVKFCHFQMLEIRGSQCPISTKLCQLVVQVFFPDWPSLKQFGPVVSEILAFEYSVFGYTVCIYIYIYIYTQVPRHNKPCHTSIFAIMAIFPKAQSKTQYY